MAYVKQAIVDRVKRSQARQARQGMASLSAGSIRAQSHAHAGGTSVLEDLVIKLSSKKGQHRFLVGMHNPEGQSCWPNVQRRVLSAPEVARYLRERAYGDFHFVARIA